MNIKLVNNKVPPKKKKTMATNQLSRRLFNMESDPVKYQHSTQNPEVFTKSTVNCKYTMSNNANKRSLKCQKEMENTESECR